MPKTSYLLPTLIAILASLPCDPAFAESGLAGVGGMGGGFKGIGGMGGGCKGLGGMGGGFRGVGDAGGGFDSARSEYYSRYHNNRYGSTYGGRFGTNQSNSYGYRFNSESETRYGETYGRYGEVESDGNYRPRFASSAYNGAPGSAIALVETLERLRAIRQNFRYCAPNQDAASFGTGSVLETARNAQVASLRSEGTGLNPDSMGAFRMYSENP